MRVYFWCLLIDPSNNKPLNILQKRMRMGKRAMMILVKIARSRLVKYCNFLDFINIMNPMIGLIRPMADL